jgi:NAD-dependent SIR2 family protein deacetylase
MSLKLEELINKSKRVVFFTGAGSKYKFWYS